MCFVALKEKTETTPLRPPCQRPKLLLRLTYYWCWLQESLSSCEDVLSLARQQDGDQEEGQAEEEEENDRKDKVVDETRVDTLKTLTETVMAMIECSSKATKRAPIKGPTIGTGRPQWPPKEREKEMEEKKKKNQEEIKRQSLTSSSTTPPPPLNNHNQSSIQGEEKKKKKKTNLDEEFQDENNYENYVNYFRSKGILFPRSMWSEERTGGCDTKSKNVNYGVGEELKQRQGDRQRMGLKLPLNLEEFLVGRAGGRRRTLLSDVSEDCEYDSERGKFNCNTNEMVEGWKGDLVVNNDTKKENLNFNANNVLPTTEQKKLLNKKIEYFENKLKPSKENNRLKEVMEGAKKDEDEEKEKECKEKKLVNILCLGSFFMTALLLYFFPLPN